MTDPKPKRGRPPKPKAELRKQTAFRLTPGCRKLLRMVSQEWGCSQADVVERAVRKAAKRELLRGVP